MRRIEAFRSLLACLRGDVPSTDDWTDILALANQTLCSPTVATRLAAADRLAGLPEDVRLFLSAMRERSEQRNRRLRAQLAEAVAALNAAAIRPLLLKGTAWLAGAAEPELGARILADLDLMVAPEARSTAVAQLVGAGYSVSDFDAGGEAAVVLSRFEDAATIDLHSGFEDPALNGAHHEIAQAARTLKLGSAEALLPIPTHQIAILVQHDQLKGRDYLRGKIDLRHLLDIELLVGDGTGVDWNRLDRLFATDYARHAFRAQLLAGRELLGIVVPDDACSGARAALQHRRRMVQLRWPVAALPLTLLSLLDPAYLRARRHYKSAEVSRSGNGARPVNGSGLPRRASLRRLFESRQLGKL